MTRNRLIRIVITILLILITLGVSIYAGGRQRVTEQALPAEDKTQVESEPENEDELPTIVEEDTLEINY